MCWRPICSRKPGPSSSCSSRRRRRRTSMPRSRSSRIGPETSRRRRPSSSVCPRTARHGRRPATSQGCSSSASSRRRLSRPSATSPGCPERRRGCVLQAAALLSPLGRSALRRGLCGPAERGSGRGAGKAAQPALAALARRIRAGVAEPRRDHLPPALPLPASRRGPGAVRSRVPPHARSGEEPPCPGPPGRGALADAGGRGPPPASRGAAPSAEERARRCLRRPPRRPRPGGNPDQGRRLAGGLHAGPRAARRARAREGDAGGAVRRERAARLPDDPPPRDAAQGARVLAVRRRVLAGRDRVLPLHAQGRLPAEAGVISRWFASLALALAPAAGSAGAATPRPSPVEATFEQKEVERDAAADRKRDELIADLQSLIPRLPETDRSADLYFQLAELYWEKARFVSLQEVQVQDEAYARWAKDRKGAEPKIDTQRSDGYRKQALRLYQLVLERYPRYERRDEVSFVAAHNLYESGNKREAIARYGALIREYPRSRFVPDAHVQMGEHFFAENDLARARASFEKAAAFRLPKLYPFALYKLAWCDFNAGDYRGAIAKFQEVIAYSEGATRRDRVQLKAEALKDIVLAFARIDAVDAAIAYLTEKGGEHATDAMDRLAGTCFQEGKLEQSTRGYRLLQERTPEDLKAPGW